jgi:hypothetical protein
MGSTRAGTSRRAQARRQRLRELVEELVAREPDAAQHLILLLSYLVHKK